ncbi:MAG: Coenzyme F420 hydrogenase/dehydrogenase, beta subunit C-terminal domain [Desulfatiglandaceae bacterium]
MMSETGTGQRRLIDEIINKDLCVRCGACVGFCPYFSYFDGQVVVMDRCRADADRCFRVCPVARNRKTLSGGVSQAPERQEIGPVEEILMARAVDADIRNKSQYGGVVTALVTWALEKGFIESAILTDRGDPFSPQGKEVRDKRGVRRCAGSRYTASGGLAALNRAVKQDRKKIGVVGLPCQMEALTQMGQSREDPHDLDERIAMKLGLFCTWALDHRKLAEFLEKEGVKGPFFKFDIPPPPAEKFQVQSQDGWKDFPLSVIRPYIQKGCLLCEDMTADKSDISVGAVEGQAHWNTVIVRTEKGASLMRKATEEGWLETDPLPQENLEHLKDAARNKSERGKRAKNDQ